MLLTPATSLSAYDNDIIANYATTSRSTQAYWKNKALIVQSLFLAIKTFENPGIQYDSLLEEELSKFIGPLISCVNANTQLLIEVTTYKQTAELEADLGIESAVNEYKKLIQSASSLAGSRHIEHEHTYLVRLSIAHQLLEIVNQEIDIQSKAIRRLQTI